MAFRSPQRFFGPDANVYFRMDAGHVTGIDDSQSDRLSYGQKGIRILVINGFMFCQDKVDNPQGLVLEKQRHGDNTLQLLIEKCIPNR